MLICLIEARKEEEERLRREEEEAPVAVTVSTDSGLDSPALNNNNRSHNEEVLYTCTCTLAFNVQPEILVGVKFGNFCYKFPIDEFYISNLAAA